MFIDCKKKRKNFQVCVNYLTKSKHDKHINLLLLQDSYIDTDAVSDVIGPKFHFVWIKNLSRLVSTQHSKHNGKKYICDRSIHYFDSPQKLCEHVQECITINDNIVPKVPSKEKNISLSQNI